MKTDDMVRDAWDLRWLFHARDKLTPWTPAHVRLNVAIGRKLAQWVRRYGVVDWRHVDTRLMARSAVVTVKTVNHSALEQRELKL